MLFVREIEMFAIAGIAVRRQLRGTRPENEIGVVMGLHEC